MDSLGDRIKEYEKVFRQTAVKRTPLMIRVDGRAFHTLTAHAKKPFDQTIIDSMVLAANDVARDIQGFRAAYIQSDEATFALIDYDTIYSEGWFDYNITKIVSLSAALMSVSFNKYYSDLKLATFDSRAFNVPENDIINAFLWRALDWSRNSLQMYSRAFFSHKQLEKKNTNDMHEMLHGIGKNWATDLTPQQKNGTFLILKDGSIEIRTDILPTYQSISEAFESLFWEYREREEDD